ncbi:MAG TPA: DinB family protein [Candidatus Limnocylindrales bacterium]|nr:DinB family protein [Candidatus Limnocylindrales bacterium]
MTPALLAHLERTYFAEYAELRGQLLDTLTDADLAFRPGGRNPTLGELCLEIGEVEHAYVESFLTFRQDFHWRNPDRSLAASVEGLRAWYAELDTRLDAALEALTAADVAGRRIDRGGEFLVDVTQQLDIYREALLIFCGKAAVYLRAMNRALPGRLAEWID